MVNERKLRTGVSFQPQPQTWTTPFDVPLGSQQTWRQGPSRLSVWIGDAENGYGYGYQVSLLVWLHVALIGAVASWVMLDIMKAWLLLSFMSVAIAAFVAVIIVARWHHRRRRTLTVARFHARE